MESNRIRLVRLSKRAGVYIDQRISAAYQPSPIKRLSSHWGIPQPSIFRVISVYVDQQGTSRNARTTVGGNSISRRPSITRVNVWPSSNLTGSRNCKTYEAALSGAASVFICPLLAGVGNARTLFSSAPWAIPVARRCVPSQIVRQPQ